MIKSLSSLGGETLFLVILGLLASLILPWWIIIPIFVVCAFLMHSPVGQSYLSGHLAASMIWGLYANYLDSVNGGILSARMGALFMHLSPTQLIWVTATLGGLLGGFAAMTGSALRQLLRPTS
jgi:hypothetical protein